MEIDQQKLAADAGIALVAAPLIMSPSEATDDALRPMGLSTSGVKGMSFRGGDSLLDRRTAYDDS